MLIICSIVEACREQRVATFCHGKVGEVGKVPAMTGRCHRCHDCHNGNGGNSPPKSPSPPDINITFDCTDWFRIGTAIASTYGEQGRAYFYIIILYYNIFHNSYTIMECDKKYDQCLRDANLSVTLGTIFHLAGQHGITLPRTERVVSEPGLASKCHNGNGGNGGKMFLHFCTFAYFCVLICLDFGTQKSTKK